MPSDDDLVKEQGLGLGDKLDPTEEVGPEGCDATVADTEAPPHRMDEPPIEAPRFFEEVGEAFVPRPDIHVPDENGLPVPADNSLRPQIAPPLTYDTVVCVEDDRAWVEVFAEEYENVSVPWPDGTRFRSRWSGGTEVTRRVFTRAEIKPWRNYFMAGDGHDWIVVRPIRPLCEHYRRQVFNNDDEPDPNRIGHRIVYRNCAARRSNGGAQMSLRDQAVYACEHRSPRDLPSEEKFIHGPDRDKLERNPHLIKLPLFSGER